MKYIILYLLLIATPAIGQEIFTGYTYKKPVIVYCTVADSELRITMLDTATQTYISFQNLHNFSMNNEYHLCKDTLGMHIIPLPEKPFTDITVYEEEPGTAYRDGDIMANNIFGIAYEVYFKKEEREKIKRFFDNHK